MNRRNFLTLATAAAAATLTGLRLVVDRRLAHGGNPVLRWMADNLIVQTDPAGNIKPNKAKSTARIDGMVALIMALDRATRHKETKSVYEGRGLRTL